jgi:hypothetical protein
MMMLSCEDDKDYDAIDTSADETVIYSIKLLNAGIDGDEVIDGIVDENTKEITLTRRVAPETDLTKLRFEAKVSDRASLDSVTYNFSVSEGESQRKRVISVVNGLRKREYFVTVRLRVPVFGADFLLPTVYDHSAASNIYPTFTGALTRGSAFDGEHVLIVTRAAAGCHLLKVSDLKNNKIAPINLDMTGVSLGTFTVHSGALANKHVYIANLSGGLASPLKLYYWETPTSVPETILNIDKNTIPGSGARHGDNMSVNIDKNGNGFIFFGDNAATQVLRFTVTNHKTISNPTILPTFAGAKATAYMSYNRVDGTADYIFTGFYAPIALVNESGSVTYTMNAASTPERGSDARVISFNGERYLIMCTAARTGSDVVVFYVYNLSKGETTAEAMQLFDARVDKSPDYQFSLAGPVNTSPATQTGWYIEKDADGNDDKLYLYAASSDAGFTIFEFPKKIPED